MYVGGWMRWIAPSASPAPGAAGSEIALNLTGRALDVWRQRVLSRFALAARADLDTRRQKVACSADGAASSLRGAHSWGRRGVIPRKTHGSRAISMATSLSLRRRERERGCSRLREGALEPQDPPENG